MRMLAASKPSIVGLSDPVANGVMVSGMRATDMILGRVSSGPRLRPRLDHWTLPLESPVIAAVQRCRIRDFRSIVYCQAELTGFALILDTSSTLPVPRIFSAS